MMINKKLFTFILSILFLFSVHNNFGNTYYNNNIVKEVSNHVIDREGLITNRINDGLLSNNKIQNSKGQIIDSIKVLNKPANVNSSIFPSDHFGLWAKIKVT